MLDNLADYETYIEWDKEVPRPVRGVLEKYDEKKEEIEEYKKEFEEYLKRVRS